MSKQGRQWWLTGQYDNPMFAFNEKPADPDAVHVLEATPARLAAEQMLEALKEAQTAILDALHAGNLSREYSNCVLEKVDTALASATRGGGE